jgi:hypothetical protein
MQVFEAGIKCAFSATSIAFTDSEAGNINVHAF